jgi:UBA/TS-N domain
MQELIDMGFKDRIVNLKALEFSNGEIEKAANYILNYHLNKTMKEVIEEQLRELETDEDHILEIYHQELEDMAQCPKHMVKSY